MEPRDGVTRSIWLDTASAPDFPALAADAQADVCVVGAGMAGLSCAYQLATQGKSVIVLDAASVGMGQTSRTSAHLASAVDDRFAEIERVHGREAARIAYQSHNAAIDSIEEIVRREDIDCDFARLTGYLLPAPGDAPSEMKEELEAAHRAGFTDATLIDCSPLPAVGAGPCIRFPRQARFHPLKYLAGLASASANLGVRIHCNTFVKEVAGSDHNAGNGGGKANCQVITSGGFIVSAGAIVVATNTPSPIRDWNGIYTKQIAYRTYVIGVSVAKGLIPDCLVWDNEEPYHYVRLEHSSGDPLHAVLVVGGEDHKVGHEGDANLAAFTRLEKWTKKLFPFVGQTLFRWSGQVQEPVDFLAYIGKAPTHGDNVYVVTGDSGMGLTHGAMAGILISDLIHGTPNEWATYYDPSRKPTGRLGEYLKDNLGTVARFADYLTPGALRREADIAPGSGAVIRHGLHKNAVYRDEQGQITSCSAVCPHMGCLVAWNGVEKTWDCPCHGSRFSATGKVVMGPATSDLAPSSTSVGESPQPLSHSDQSGHAD